MSEHPQNKPTILGVSFIGVRTGSIAKMRKFLAEGFGLRIKHEEPEFIAFQTPRGDRIELFGPNDLRHRHFTTGPVAGFEVADIFAALDVLKSQNVEILSEVMGRPEGTQWVHFRGPDGNVYEIVRHVDFHSDSPK